MKHKLYPGKKMSEERIKSLYVEFGTEMSFKVFCNKVLEIDDHVMNALVNGELKEAIIFYDRKNRKRIYGASWCNT